MRSIEFMLTNDPTAQGRARISSRGGFARAYDPKSSRDAKAIVSSFVRNVMSDKIMLSGPIMIIAEFGCPLPKTYHRKTKPVEASWRTKKPDLDNFVKLVQDACNEIVYKDDSQVVRELSQKITCAQGDEGYTRVQFVELPPYNEYDKTDIFDNNYYV